MSCLCPNPICPVDHASIRQQNDELREALMACPAFRDEALANEGCELLTAATTPDELWAAMHKTCTRYINWLVACAASPSMWRVHKPESEVLDDACREYRCGPYAVRKIAA